MSPVAFHLVFCFFCFFTWPLEKLKSSLGLVFVAFRVFLWLGLVHWMPRGLILLIPPQERIQDPGGQGSGSREEEGLSWVAPTGAERAVSSPDIGQPCLRMVPICTQEARPGIARTLADGPPHLSVQRLTHPGTWAVSREGQMIRDRVLSPCSWRE